MVKGEIFMYNRRYMYPNNYNERQFIVPFLLGGLAGGAAVGLTRPRPIYNVAPNTPYQPPYYGGAPFYNNSYSYYVPYPYYR